MKRLFVHSFKSTIGTLRLAATEEALVLVDLPNNDGTHFDRWIKKEFESCQLCDAGEINSLAEREIHSYLAGDLREFSIKLQITGTDFQKRALKQVAKIPYGKTETYGQIARKLGQPGASRAVGNANAKNPLPLIIPCHRVLASNGLGGYGGGLPLKKRLLELEGALGSVPLFD